MQFLLFIISFCFSSIFYIFFVVSNRESIFLNNQEILNLKTISGNLLIETSIFLIVSVFLFLYYSNLFNKNVLTNLSFFDKQKFYNYLINFFRNYIYFIGLIFFYISIYLIIYSFNYIKLQYFILFLNLIIFLLFFLYQKFFIIKDFVKINTVIFSIYYLFIFIYYFYIGTFEFSNIDYLNTIFVFVFFLLNFYYDFKSIEKKQVDTIIIPYFFSYFFFLLCFYLSFLIGKGLFLFNLISLLFFSFTYLLSIKVDYFKRYKFLLKKISIIFLYISTVYAIVIFFKEGINYFSLFTIMSSCFINFYIHNKYQNYLSLFFFSSTLLFLFYFFYFKFYYFGINKENIFIFLSLSLAGLFVLSTYIYKFKYIYDYYFFHILGYLINIISSIYYFYITSFDIFNFGIILLYESIFIFFSYYKLKSLAINYEEK